MLTVSFILQVTSSLNFFWLIFDVVDRVISGISSSAGFAGCSVFLSSLLVSDPTKNNQPHCELAVTGHREPGLAQSVKAISLKVSRQK